MYSISNYTFIELGITYLLAIMMPGPSIAMITKNGLLYSRFASLKSAFGTTAGIAVQSGMAIIGFSFIEKNPFFLNIIKIICSFYLIFIGFKMLLTQKSLKEDCLIFNKHFTKSKSINYFFEGFLVEFLNPLAFTFFISIMATVIVPENLWFIKFMYWFEMCFLGFIWFTLVAYVMSSKKVTLRIKNFNQSLQIIAGIVFIVFGSKLFVG